MDADDIAVTYCRICPGACGVLVEHQDNVVTGVMGDRDHPLTAGYTCAKGRNMGGFHSAPNRFVKSQRRNAAGTLEPIEFGTATAEIADQLTAIVDRHGPDAVALFLGTQSVFATLTRPAAHAWFRSLGSHKLFFTMTIDQSAKWLRALRLGDWAGGRQRFDESDVWMLIGTNPLMTMQGGDFTGVPVQNGPQELRRARERGLKLIVIDPRRTETAAQADIHLRPRPGTDAALVAGLLQVILSEGLYDSEFCAQHVYGLELLRHAVRDMTPAATETSTGVPADQIAYTARVFAGSVRGMAMSGTGPDMGPDANVAEHLIGALNVVCGRFPRAGDRAARDGVLSRAGTLTAQVIGPSRPWESGFQSRIGYGRIHNELPSAILPAEILEPGADRVRALVVVGGNPASAIPDQVATVRALQSLDLLVTIEPFPNETARLAHYVIAPTLMLERADHTGLFDGVFPAPFAQHAARVLEPPPGVVEDWVFFAELAARMALPIKLAGRVLQPTDERPSSHQYLTWTAERGRVAFDDVVNKPHGRMFSNLSPLLVGPADDDADGRFDLLPVDVEHELKQALAPRDRLWPFSLVVRRQRRTMNSLGRGIAGLARDDVNPCYIHPDDMNELGTSDGDAIRVIAEHGTIETVCSADPTMMPGVVALSHGYGGLPGDDHNDPLTAGSNPGRLLSLTDSIQTITGMPIMNAIPVAIERIEKSKAVRG